MAPARFAPKLTTLIAAVIAGALCFMWTQVYMRVGFGWLGSDQTTLVSGFYGAGCGLGLLTALWVDQLAGNRWQSRKLRRFLVPALAIVLVLAFTVGLLAFQYRLYFSQWHEPFLSRPWMLQLFFTTLGAVAQYGIFGVRYHGVGSLVIVLATCWWAMRTRH